MSKRGAENERHGPRRCRTYSRAATRLAEKGRILYRKSCGSSGKKTCAESFAIYHVRRGEADVARDLLAFLETEADVLRKGDPDGATGADVGARCPDPAALVSPDSNGRPFRRDIRACRSL